ncbi:MAG: hypothetical protein U1C73_14180 [Dietzia sp.]|nr:hypothetical protein [Dietzia sp.]
MTVETACRQLPHSPTGGVIAVKRRPATTTAIGSNWSTMDDYADLLTRLNAGVITSWHAYDAEDFPLRQVMAYHDVLIDLAGAAPEDLAPGRTITTPESPYEYGSLVLPGLLRAVCAHPHPRLTLTFSPPARAVSRW